MSITKTATGWKVEVRRRNPYFRVRKVVETKKEAIRIEAEIRRELENSVISQGGIEDALQKYLQGEATTLTDYEGIKSKARAILPFIHKKTFSDIAQVSAEIKRVMLEDGLAVATINRRLALLRRLGNLAFEWDWIDYPAGKRVRTISGERERHYYLTLEEVQSLIDLCPKTGHLIKIAAYTGMRRNELLSLQPGQVMDGWIIQGSKKRNKRPRRIPVPEPVIGLVESLPLPLEKTWDYLLRREFENARNTLGMPHIRFHDLRHSYASYLAQHGATLQLIGKALGHSSTQMTSRYAHLVEENLRELADKFR